MVERPTVLDMPTRPGKPSIPAAQAARVVAALRELFREENENKAALGRRLGGMSGTAVGKLLDGTNRPSLDTAAHVARLKGVPVSDLLGLHSSAAHSVSSPTSLTGGEEAGERMGTMLRIGRADMPTLEALVVSDERRRVRRWTREVSDTARAGFFGLQDLSTDEWEERLDELQALWAKWHTDNHEVLRGDDRPHGRIHG